MVKKILGSLFFLMLVSSVYAATLVKSAGTTTMSTSAISASSTTATLGLDTNYSRRGMEAFNTGTVTVYISTYAATATTALYPVLSNSSFCDNIESYQGAWYFLTTAGSASQNIRIIEKTSSSY